MRSFLPCPVRFPAESFRPRGSDLHLVVPDVHRVLYVHIQLFLLLIVGAEIFLGFVADQHGHESAHRSLYGAVHEGVEEGNLARQPRKKFSEHVEPIDVLHPVGDQRIAQDRGVDAEEFGVRGAIAVNAHDLLDQREVDEQHGEGVDLVALRNGSGQKHLARRSSKSERLRGSHVRGIHLPHRLFSSSLSPSSSAASIFSAFSEERYLNL